MEFSTLVRFSQLVSDSPSSEGVFSLLSRTVVEQCSASHALVFGTTADGEFRVLSSYGGCAPSDVNALELEGVCTVADLRASIIRTCGDRGYQIRVVPLISDAGLFGALAILFTEEPPLTERQWTLIEGLTELTAISLNKTYQHQRLQRAFDDLRISQDVLIRTEKFRALANVPRHSA